MRTLSAPQVSRARVPREDSRVQFLSDAQCREIIQRLTRLAKGGGYTAVQIESSWTGNVRWARNQVITSGEVGENKFTILRAINGANAQVDINEQSDVAFVGALRRAERLLLLSPEFHMGELIGEISVPPSQTPKIYSEATYQLDADRRAEAARTLAQSAVDANMLSAGYVEVSAHSRAVFDSLDRSRYFQWTFAQYSVTVRDPKGTGSGWAGADSDDWAKINGPALSRVALEKCLTSRTPARIEPGRYTVILEPQAVCDLTESFFSFGLRRGDNEGLRTGGPFWKAPGFSKLGERVVDSRISLSTDPMDPELGYPPWEQRWGYPEIFGEVLGATTWIDKGVLTNLSYELQYAMTSLGRDIGMGSLSFRMSGGTTTIEEMIETTKRGLLVTRFDRVNLIDVNSGLSRGITRDGLWLIENGKITKACKNLVFLDSPLFVLNKIDDLGVPKRVFRPPPPQWGMSGPIGVIVPALKVQEFSFVALSDAV